MIKSKHSIVVQSKSPKGKFKDVAGFPCTSDFELSDILKDAISNIKREFKQDLPKFKVRVVKRVND